MTRWVRIAIALAIGGALPLGAAARPLVGAQARDARPNIIVILADDLGYNDVGFTGKTDIRTPVLDKLAADGVIFSNGYVTHPYCGPSRAGLLTGRYQARFGMENNVTFAPNDPHMGLPLGEVTLADRLKKVGYRTAVFGKWHLGAAPHFQPNRRGFDYFYGFLDGGHQYMPGEVAMHRDGYWEPLLRNDKPTPFAEYLTTLLSRDAAQFIAAPSDLPFFIYMSYNAPHTPLQAPKVYTDKYRHIADPDRRTYAAMVDAMDEGIGMLITALKASGKYENTLIFFLSDNGGVYPEAWQPTADWADNSPFRRGKVSLLEGGVHVPFIAHWPRRIRPGQTLAGLVSALDIAATSVAVAGADDSDRKLEGVDLTPYVTGKKRGSPHAALFWRLEEADHLWAVRTPDAKYVRQTLPETGHAFYDMTRDPTERQNLLGQRKADQARLARLWNEWNAKNVNNVLQQSHDYAVTVEQFYDDLYKRRVQQAKERKPYLAQ
jgi:arylsulfatase A-like enzyme